MDNGLIAPTAHTNCGAQGRRRHLSIDAQLAIPGQAGCDGADSQGTPHRWGWGRFTDSQQGMAGRELGAGGAWHR